MPGTPQERRQRSEGSGRRLESSLMMFDVWGLMFDVSRVESAIESFIRYLAVERGLSDNYQLSTQRSLTDFAKWCAGTRKIGSFKAVNLATISEYLADKKRAALSAASIKLIVVALKIFFRFLAGKGEVKS